MNSDNLRIRGVYSGGLISNRYSKCIHVLLNVKILHHSVHNFCCFLFFLVFYSLFEILCIFSDFCSLFLITKPSENSKSVNDFLDSEFALVYICCVIACNWVILWMSIFCLCWVQACLSTGKPLINVWYFSFYLCPITLWTWFSSFSSRKRYRETTLKFRWN